MFETSVDRLCRAVGCAGSLEVGEHVGGAPVEGAAEGDQLGEGFGTPARSSAMISVSVVFAVARSGLR